MSDSLGLSQCNGQPMGFLALRTLPFNWSGLCFELIIGAPTELLWRAEVHVTHKILLSLFFFEGGAQQRFHLRYTVANWLIVSYPIWSL